MAHTSIKVERKEESRTKTIAELQKGDWFFVDGEYHVRTDYIPGEDKEVPLINCCSASGILRYLGKNIRVRPVKNLTLKVEWI